MLFPVTLSDSNYPNHPIATFSIAFHIFVVSEDRDFKFGGYKLTMASASTWMANHPERVVDRSREPFTFCWSPTTSLEQLIVSGAVNLVGRSVW